MTDLATAMADNSALPPYEGQQVVRTTISIRNAGDGLSEGLGIDPQLLAIGSKVYVVLECDVDAHDHKRLKDAPELLVLDQVLKAGTGTLIDADVVKEAIAQQAQKIADAKDAVKRNAEAKDGVQRIPYDEELHAAHQAGLHPEPVEGCADCDPAPSTVAGDGTGEALAPTDQPPEGTTPITGRKPRARKRAGG